MDWIQVDGYMIVVEREKTYEQYEKLDILSSESYQLFREHYLKNDELSTFLQQFGIAPIKPTSLESLIVEEGQAILFTGKYYFEGFLELGEYDLWDLIVGAAVFSFTQEEAAPFSSEAMSYVELSFEMVLPVN